VMSLPSRKTQSANDLMDEAPNTVDEKQLRELHIRTAILLKKDDKKDEKK
jgi:aspartyl-tRNA synthetase